MTHEELKHIAEFQAIASCAKQVASFYLSAMDGRLEAALDYYFRTDGLAHLDVPLAAQVPAPDSHGHPVPQRQIERHDVAVVPAAPLNHPAPHPQLQPKQVVNPRAPPAVQQSAKQAAVPRDSSAQQMQLPVAAAPPPDTPAQQSEIAFAPAPPANPHAKQIAVASTPVTNVAEPGPREKAKPKKSSSRVVELAREGTSELKSELRAVLQQEMVAIRDERQKQRQQNTRGTLQSDMAGGYVMHFTELRRLLETLDEPGWGSAKQFLTVFPAAQVDEYGERMLLVYRRFRAEHLNDVMPELSNSEKRALADAAEAERKRNRSSTSASSDSDAPLPPKRKGAKQVPAKATKQAPKPKVAPKNHDDETDDEDNIAPPPRSQSKKAMAPPKKSRGRRIGATDDTTEGSSSETPTVLAESSSDTTPPPPRNRGRRPQPKKAAVKQEMSDDVSSDEAALPASGDEDEAPPRARNKTESQGAAKPQVEPSEQGRNGQIQQLMAPAREHAVAPNPKGNEVRPRRRRAENEPVLSAAKFAQVVKAEWEHHCHAMEALQMTGSCAFESVVRVAGEEKSTSSFPIVSLKMKLPCIPFVWFESFKFSDMLELGVLLYAFCSCCRKKHVSGSGLLARIATFFMDQGILSPVETLDENINNLSGKTQHCFDLWRASNCVAPCDSDEHLKLFEMIDAACLLEKKKKREGRPSEVVRPLNIEVVRTRPHEIEVKIFLSPMKTKKPSLSFRLACMTALRNVCEHIADANGTPHLIAQYPMLPREDFSVLARLSSTCKSHQDILKEVSVQPDDDNPLPQAETPPTIAVSLKQYQRESLHWMLQKESLGFRDFAQFDIPLSPGHVLLFNPLQLQVRIVRKECTAALEAMNPLIRGGFLCDEMGLGKTVEVLALIAANPLRGMLPPFVELPQHKRWSFRFEKFSRGDPAQAVEEESSADDEVKTETLVVSTQWSDPALVPFMKVYANSAVGKRITSHKAYTERNKLTPIKATLIVVPVSICGQWITELVKVAPKLRYVMFHGTERHNFTVEDLQEADVVFTTYETLGAQLKAEKEDYVVSASRPHPEATPRINTLLTTILKKYKDGSKTNSSLSLDHFADPPLKEVPCIRQAFTGPGGAIRIFADSIRAKRGDVVISRIRFHRLIFDESQKCAGGSYNNFIDDLHATHRWIVTGTPIHGQLPNIKSLFRVVGSTAYLKPMDIFGLLDREHREANLSYYTVRSAVDAWVRQHKASLRQDDPVTSMALEAAEKALTGYNYRILHEDIPLEVRNYTWMVLFLLKAYMIRHLTRGAVQAEIELPPRTDVVVPVTLTPDEVALYDRVSERVRNDFCTLQRQERIGNRISRVMMWVDLLQRAALHPGLVSENRVSGEVTGAGTENENAKYAFENISPEDLLAKLSKMDGVPTSAMEAVQKLNRIPPEVDECGVCLATMSEPTLLKCNHFLCRECILAIISTSQDPRCPTCRAASLLRAVKFQVKLRTVEVRIEEKVAIEAAIARVGHGSKAKAIMKIITDALQADATEKFIIFSKFPQFIGTLEKTLQENRISFIVIDGSTSLKKRASLINDFQSVGGRNKVCIVSSRAGNAGLTLTAANHLILAEPGLNEAVELQAAARVHRFGQTRPVTVHKLFAKGTIEERIYNLAAAGQLAGQGGQGSLDAAAGRGQVGSANINQIIALLS